MKVTFINPPQTNSKYKFLGVVAPSLGIGYMSAVLEENDIDVDVIDASALDLSYEQIAEEIIKRQPDIVSISALTPTIGVALDSADVVKYAKPDTIVVLGGYHPTFEFASVLEEESVDIVIRGEGEYTMLDLVHAIEEERDLKQVQGLAFHDKDDGSLVVTEDRPIIENLDELPFPALHLMPMDKYKILNISTNVATVITTRGCPMQCSFCSSAALHGRHLRRRSPENVVDEIEHILNDLDGIDTIAFMDDTFTLNTKFVRDFCAEIKRRNLNFWWGCTSRVDTIDTELLEIMKETYDFVMKLDPSYALFSLATPYPGTRFYKESFEKNLIKVKDWSKYTLIEPVLETVECSKEELRSFQKKAFLKFYLRPGYLFRQARMDGAVLVKTIFGVAKQIIKKQTNGNTDYNKKNIIESGSFGK